MAVVTDDDVEAARAELAASHEEFSDDWVADRIGELEGEAEWRVTRIRDGRVLASGFADEGDAEAWAEDNLYTPGGDVSLGQEDPPELTALRELDQLAGEQIGGWGDGCSILREDQATRRWAQEQYEEDMSYGCVPDWDDAPFRYIDWDRARDALVDYRDKISWAGWRWIGPQ